MSQVLSNEAKKLLREPVLAHIATIDADGLPALTPVWVDIEGDDVVINTAEGRVKTKNLRSNPNVAVSVVDPADPHRVLALRGIAVEFDTESADKHADFLAGKYTGDDRFESADGRPRVKIRIRTERIVMQP